MTEVMQDHNGQAYLEYAPGEGKLLLISWVQIMMEDLYKENPELFGRLVQRAALAGRGDVMMPSLRVVTRTRSVSKGA